MPSFKVNKASLDQPSDPAHGDIGSAFSGVEPQALGYHGYQSTDYVFDVEDKRGTLTLLFGLPRFLPWQQGPGS